MKIVLDTNVFISGIFWKGSPSKILNLWANNKIEVVVTKKIVSEYLRVIKKIDQSEELSSKWKAFIQKNSIMLIDKSSIKICRDPDDDKFLNAALTGKVQYIVSGDDDQLILKSIDTIKIITPAQFLNRIRFR